MKRLLIRRLMMLAGLAGAAIAAMAPLEGQTRTATPAAAPPKPFTRTVDGHPDLQGFWMAAVQGTYDLRDPRTGGGRLDEIDRERRGLVRQRKPSRIVDPPGGDIPYQPWARAKFLELTSHIDNPTRPEHIDTQVRCLPTAVPRSLYFGQFKIVQGPGSVLILHEGYHLFRLVPLDGRPHAGPNTRLWMGDSRGRWEGDTLVVDVTNFNGKPRLAMVGDFASDRLHVVERWTPVNADTIDYRATLDDPTVFTRPWTVGIQFRRRVQPGYEFWEEGCHEGERSAEQMTTRTDNAVGQ